MRGRVSWDEWVCIAILLAMAAVLPLTGKISSFPIWTSAGTVLLVVVALCGARIRQELILLGFLLPLSLVAVGVANGIVLGWTPHTIDSQLRWLDGGISVDLYRWTAAHPLVLRVLQTVYYGLPLFGAFVLSISPQRMLCARGWVIAALLAPIFYVLFPAVGPAHLGQSAAPRNCIPSLHMTWALICVVYMRPRLRWIAILFALLTAAATVGLGEHYLVDLVVAAPYALLVCGIPIRVGKREPGQRLPALKMPSELLLSRLRRNCRAADFPLN